MRLSVACRLVAYGARSRSSLRRAYRFRLRASGWSIPTAAISGSWRAPALGVAWSPVRFALLRRPLRRLGEEIAAVGGGRSRCGRAARQVIGVSDRRCTTWSSAAADRRRAEFSRSGRQTPRLAVAPARAHSARRAWRAGRASILRSHPDVSWLALAAHRRLHHQHRRRSPLQTASGVM